MSTPSSRSPPKATPGPPRPQRAECLASPPACLSMTTERPLIPLLHRGKRSVSRRLGRACGHGVSDGTVITDAVITLGGAVGLMWQDRGLSFRAAVRKIPRAS